MLTKIMSGRWLLTIACAFVFVYCSLNKMLTAETITAILMFVFQGYFQRTTEQKREDAK